jgi:hypothetical protein
MYCIPEWDICIDACIGFRFTAFSHLVSIGLTHCLLSLRRTITAVCNICLRNNMYVRCRRFGAGVDPELCQRILQKLHSNESDTIQQKNKGHYRSFFATFNLLHVHKNSQKICVRFLHGCSCIWLHFAYCERACCCERRSGWPSV